MNATYQSSYGYDETVARLRDALSTPTLSERFLPAKARLSGKVKPPAFCLYRSLWASSGMLLHRFEGEIHGEGDKAVLDGQYVVPPNPILTMVTVGFFLGGVLALIAPLLRWQGGDSVATAVVGAVFVALAVAIRKGRAMNLKAEREMMEEEIRRVIGEGQA